MGSQLNLIALCDYGLRMTLLTGKLHPRLRCCFLTASGVVRSALALTLVALGCTANQPRPPGPEAIRVSSDAKCTAEPPAADYVAARFAGLALRLPPSYREVINEPGALTNAAMWVAQDSSALFVGMADSQATFEERALLVTEGLCSLTVAASNVQFTQYHATERDTGMTAFIARAVVRTAAGDMLDLVVIGRSRDERSRLLGVLGAVETQQN
jgi:hypothetical protein